MNAPKTLLCWLILVLASAPALAQDLAIRAGHVIVRGDQAPLEGATVLIVKGRVVAVGTDVAVPEGVTLVQRPTAWVVPAWVDASTALGLVGDRDEVTHAIEPDVTTRFSIDPQHRDFRAARAAGIGTALVSPGDRNLFSGEGTVVRTDGTPLPGAPSVAKLALSPTALSTDRPPTSRTGALELLRRTLGDAHQTDMPTTGLERFARGDEPGLFTVTSSQDALSAYELALPYGLQLVLKLGGGFEAKDVKGLPLEGQPVVLGPYSLRSGHRELGVAREVASLGARLAFSSGAPQGPEAGLRLTAVLAVQAGLDSRQALLALTQGGADALGIGDLVGSLEEGKHGDLVVLSGPPLDLGSRVLELYLEGRRVHRRPPPSTEAGS